MEIRQSAPDRQANGHEPNQSIVPRAQVQLARPTLLGQQTPRIPIGGRIRAGIKVLTRKAEANDRAREIYARGVEAGRRNHCGGTGSHHAIDPSQCSLFHGAWRGLSER
jgi:hypothetical protein